MNFSWDKVEKIFRLFFPEFSNKVTWAVVVVGLGLTSTSLIEKLIQGLFKVTYNIEIFGESDAVIGLCLVALGLVHNIVLQREKTKIEIASNIPADNTEHREHDKNLFRYLNNIMDEDTLNSIFNTLEIDHAYYYSRYALVEKFMYEIEKADNSYVDQDINESLDVVKLISEKFNSFVINNFSQLPRGTNDDWMCLHPYWNCDRGGIFSDKEQDIKYDAAAQEMFDLIKNYKSAYNDYRKLIKTKLAV